MHRDELAESIGAIRADLLIAFLRGEDGHANAEIIAEILLDAIQKEVDGAMWSDRAAAFLSIYLRLLFWQAGEENRVIDRKFFLDGLHLANIVRWADRTTTPDVPAVLLRPLKSFLDVLPGFDETKGADQGEVRNSQFGYLVRHFYRFVQNLDIRPAARPGSGAAM